MKRGAIAFLFLLSLNLRCSHADETPLLSITAAPSQITDSTSSVSAIPLGEITSQAESASVNLEGLQSALSNDAVIRPIEEDLPALDREINIRLQESYKVISLSPSLDTLRHMEHNWNSMSEDISNWEKDLARHATLLDKQIREVDQIDATWRLTAQSAGTLKAPADLNQSIQSVMAQADKARLKIQKRRDQLLDLQNRVGRQSVRVSQVLAAVRQAEEEALSHLFVRDSPPLCGRHVRKLIPGKACCKKAKAPLKINAERYGRMHIARVSALEFMRAFYFS